MIETAWIGIWLGKNMALIRKRHGLTQEQFAEILELTRQQVSNYECGNVRDPSHLVVKRLAEFSGIPIEKLTDGILKGEDLHVENK